jgi:HupE/UreJ protein
MRASFARSGLILSLLLFFTLSASARDVPDDLSFQIFVKPAENKLQLLVRAPFQAFGDIRFPLHAELGNLDLTQIDTVLPGTARWWIADSIDLYENGAQVPKPEVIETRVAVQSDRSFSTYESALAHVTGERLPVTTQIFPNQAWLDVLLEYPIRSAASSFSVRTRFARFGGRVTTGVHFIATTGAIRSFVYEGDPKTFALDPLAAEVASRFFQLGFSTILRTGALLLCLVCLALPFRRLSVTIPLVAAFLAAFTIALVARRLMPGVLWFPTLVETLTAASIVYLGFENILGLAAPRRRYMAALGFGLLF